MRISGRHLYDKVDRDEQQLALLEEIVLLYQCTSNTAGRMMASRYEAQMQGTPDACGEPK